MITHDKRGKPLHPTVQEILNLEVPVLNKKRKVPTTRSRGVSSSIPPQKVPNLTEVPALDPQDSPAAANIPLARSLDTESEPAEPAEPERVEPARLSISPPKALEWLRSLLVGAAPLLDEKHELRAELRAELEAPAAPESEPKKQPPSEPQSGQAEPQAEQMQRAEQVARSPPTLSMNSAFYRVLALETQMCLRGKLDAPNVTMALPRERGPRKRREWVDLAQAGY